MITRIAINGFNGQTAEYTLSQHTLFIGPVGSGKSSVGKAIQFVLQPTASANLPGVFDEHYDRSSKTNKFSATLTFADGRAVTRRLVKDAKGKVTQIFFDGKNKKFDRKQEVELLKDIGITLPDINTFLSLSAQKQIAYLLNLATVDAEIDIEGMNNAIDMAQVLEVELQNKVLGRRRVIYEIESELEAFPVASDVTIEGLKRAQADLADKIAMVEAQLAEQERLVMMAEAKRREDEAAENARIKAENKARREAEEEQVRQADRVAQAWIASERKEAEAVAKVKAEEEAKAQAAQEQFMAKVLADKAKERAVEIRREEQENARIEAQRKAGPIAGLYQPHILPDALPGLCEQCHTILAQITGIIDLIKEPSVCHKCGEKQMGNPAGLPLKKLRNEIQKGMDNRNGSNQRANQRANNST